MKQDAIQYVNNLILSQAARLSYTVKDIAPDTEKSLFNSTGLVIWSGASDNTIYQDKRVNWAFRALHDQLHLETRLDFSVDAEMELGRIQASKYNSRLVQELVFCEVAGQALHFKQTGTFVVDQVKFALTWMKNKGF